MKEVLVVGKSSSLSAHFCNTFASYYKFYFTTSCVDDDSGATIYNLLEPNFIIPAAGITHAIIFAGLSDIKYIEAHRDISFNVNFEGTVRLVGHLNKVGIKTLFISSSTVFSNDSLLNYESSPRNPSTYYGYLKMLTEDSCLQNNLNSIVRVSKCFNSSSILSVWADKLRSNQPIECFDDLLVSPVPMSAITALINSWINDLNPTITHVSSSSHLSYYKLAHLLCKYLKKDSDLVHKISVNSMSSRPLYYPQNPCLMSQDFSKFIVDTSSSVEKIFSEICP